MRLLRIPYDAYVRFIADDGWAIGGYIALTTLMSLFPFLIVVTELAGFLSTKDIADQVAQLLLDAWPKEVATPIADEIRDVLTTVRGSALTLGAVLGVYFSSSCVESLRVGLNRAYSIKETRNWVVLRLESIGYVLVAAVGLLALSFLVVLGPLVFRTALLYAPWLAEVESHFNIGRFVVASVLLITSLLILHMWLPAGRRRFAEVWPGIVATLAMWLTCGFVFGRYLSDFSYTYVNYYAGLASAMMALVFLYFTALIFIYGGELNAAIARLREDGTELPLS